MLRIPLCNALFPLNHTVTLFPGQILTCRVISGPDTYTTTHLPNSPMSDMYVVLIYLITYFVSNFILMQVVSYMLIIFLG